MKQRGDTIVEVLFAMVVIGISLAAAFGIANRSLQISRASQERTEAQKVAETQIEMLKIVISAETLNPGLQAIKNPSVQNFCLLKNASNEIEKVNVNSSGEECKNIYPLGSGNRYSAEVEASGSGGDVNQYRVTINWDRIGTDSNEEGVLTLYYRPGYIVSFEKLDFKELLKLGERIFV